MASSMAASRRKQAKPQKMTEDEDREYAASLLKKAAGGKSGSSPPPMDLSLRRSPASTSIQASGAGSGGGIMHYHHKSGAAAAAPTMAMPADLHKLMMTSIDPAKFLEQMCMLASAAATGNGPAPAAEKVASAAVAAAAPTARLLALSPPPSSSSADGSGASASARAARSPSSFHCAAPDCQKSFTSMGSLAWHVEQEHCDRANGERDEEEEEEEGEEDESSGRGGGGGCCRLIQCIACLGRFASRAQYSSHMCPASDAFVPPRPLSEGGELESSTGGGADGRSSLPASSAVDFRVIQGLFEGGEDDDDDDDMDMEESGDAEDGHEHKNPSSMPAAVSASAAAASNFSLLSHFFPQIAHAPSAAKGCFADTKTSPQAGAAVPMDLSSSAAAPTPTASSTFPFPHAFFGGADAASAISAMTPHLPPPAPCSYSYMTANLVALRGAFDARNDFGASGGGQQQQLIMGSDDDWEALMEVSTTDEAEKIRALVGDKPLPTTDPNQCIICRRVLSCKSALQMHYRTHTGERPFKCRICQRAFTTKGNLKTHMGVHRAKHAFRGPMSGPAGPGGGGHFSAPGGIGSSPSPGGASASAAAAAPQQQCPICQKRFVTVPQLQAHIAQHTQQLRLNGAAAAAAAAAGGANGGDEKPSVMSSLLPPGFPGAFPLLPFMAAAGGNGAAPSPFSADAFKLAAMLAQQHRHFMIGQQQQQQPSPVKTESDSSAVTPWERPSPTAHPLASSASEENPTNIGAGGDAANKTLAASIEALFKHSGVVSALLPPPSAASAPPTTTATAVQNSSISPSASSDVSGDRHEQTDGSSISQTSDAEEATAITSSVSSDVIANNAGTTKSTTTTASPISGATVSAALPLSPADQLVQPPHEKSSNPLDAMKKMWAETEPPPPRQLPVLSKHQCSVCFKHFSSSSALQIHMRTHTGDKPFKCDVCSRAFTTRGNLKVHMGTHMWQQSPSRRGRRIFEPINEGSTPSSAPPGAAAAAAGLAAAFGVPPGIFGASAVSPLPTSGAPPLDMLMMLWRTVCSVCQKVCASPAELELHLKAHLSAASPSPSTASSTPSAADHPTPVSAKSE